MRPAVRSRLVSIAAALTAALVACALTDDGAPTGAPPAVDTMPVRDGDRVTVHSGGLVHLSLRGAQAIDAVEIPGGADDVVHVGRIDGTTVTLHAGVPALTLVDVVSDGRRHQLTLHVLPSADVQPSDARFVAHLP